MSKRISIKDIAEKVGASVTTVSFVVNGKAAEKNISKALTEKIKKVVAELGYQPSSLARSLRTGKSKIIGFLVDDISKPFFSEIAKFIDEKASASGYKIIFSSTGNDQNRAAEILKIFQDRHVDGYIIALAEGIETEVINLINSGAPVVLFDRYLPELNVDYVLTDNFSSTQNATRHLLDNKFDKIGFITIDTDQRQMLDRLAGYEEMIAPFHEPRVLKVKYENSASSQQQIKNFISENPDLKALLFAANYLTMDGLKLSKNEEGNPLNNKAILSFDDFELLEYVSPSITAVEQPIQDIAEYIIKLLIKKMNIQSTDRKPEPQMVKLGTKLNIRQSTAALQNK
ncbi:LacI family DNA-binding transcriptional regulator [Pedobacter sp. BMA]|uniref:LacI family DNA-binding transcriptional regulator n=1 Tax=Pedobacter sp. BMA TaxID=1663685 RepID=UPI00064A7D12|nr:LacI family DNA-binding transcriptional regulator [Pedobacter sp. BMA]KLT65675.1 LacI family transcriptional regulator [Pedobacter sp. BMA]